MTDEQKIEAVTATLVGSFVAGQHVRVKHSEKHAVVKSTRDDGRWVRVVFPTGGHWEFFRTELEYV